MYSRTPRQCLDFTKTDQQGGWHWFQAGQDTNYLPTKVLVLGKDEGAYHKKATM
jgi:hypothetical protein